MAETLKDAGPIIDIKFSDALKVLFETDDSSYVALREKVFKYIITFRLVYLSDLFKIFILFGNTKRILELFST